VKKKFTFENIPSIDESPEQVGSSKKILDRINQINKCILEQTNCAITRINTLTFNLTPSVKASQESTSELHLDSIYNKAIHENIHDIQ